MAINPTGMTAIQWADAVVLTVGGAYLFGRLDDEANWQEWAKTFCTAPGFAQRNPPNPYQFAEWRDWAERAYTMLEPVTEVV